MLYLEFVRLVQYLIRCYFRVLFEVGANVVFDRDKSLPRRQCGNRPEAKSVMDYVRKAMECIIGQIGAGDHAVPFIEKKPKIRRFVIPCTNYEGDWHRSQSSGISCSLGLIEAGGRSIRVRSNDKDCDLTVTKRSQLIEVPAAASRGIDEAPHVDTITAKALRHAVCDTTVLRREADEDLIWLSARLHPMPPTDPLA